MRFPIAIQLYSVRHACKNDLAATLKSLKEMGYDGVEFAGLHGHCAAAVREMCEQIGLTPISAHVAYAELMEDPRGVLSQYKEIGCRFVALPSIPTGHRPGEALFAKTLEDIKMLGGIAKELGVQLLYHNHDFEFVKLEGGYGLDVMYDTVPADLLQTELDTCWVKVAGEDPVAYLDKYAGRAPVVHLKDFYGERSANMYELIGEKNEAPKRPSNFEFRPIGAGLQAFPDILAACARAGAAWVVVEQDQPSMGLDEMECAAKSMAYLRALMA